MDKSLFNIMTKLKCKDLKISCNTFDIIYKECNFQCNFCMWNAKASILIGVL